MHVVPLVSLHYKLTIFQAGMNLSMMRLRTQSTRSQGRPDALSTRFPAGSSVSEPNKVFVEVAALFFL